jgi:hypothetical protein
MIEVTYFVQISCYNGNEQYVPMYVWKLLEFVILTPELMMTDTELTDIHMPTLRLIDYPACYFLYRYEIVQ